MNVTDGRGLMALSPRAQAQEVASRGRYGDNMLVHMNPYEVAMLSRAGALTVNPDTGYPEAFLGINFKKLLKGVGSFLAPVLGGIALGPVGAGLASGLYEGLTEKNLKKGILGGLMSFTAAKALQGASGAVGAQKAATNAAKNQAVGEALKGNAARLMEEGLGQAALKIPESIGTKAASNAARLGLGEMLRVGGEGALDALSDPKMMSFVYPQIGNVSAAIQAEEAAQSGDISTGGADAYAEALRKSRERYLAKFGSNPYGNIYAYTRGYAGGGEFEGGDSSENQEWKNTSESGGDEESRGEGYVPPEGSGTGTGEKPWSGGEGEGSEDDTGDTSKGDGNNPGGGTSGTGDTGKPGDAGPGSDGGKNIPPLTLTPMDPNAIPSWFIPGFMPEFAYFGGPGSAEYNADLQGFQMQGINPFAVPGMDKVMEAVPGFLEGLGGRFAGVPSIEGFGLPWEPQGSEFVYDPTADWHYPTPNVGGGGGTGTGTGAPNDWSDVGRTDTGSFTNPPPLPPPTDQPVDTGGGGLPTFTVDPGTGWSDDVGVTDNGSFTNPPPYIPPPTDLDGFWWLSEDEAGRPTMGFAEGGAVPEQGDPLVQATIQAILGAGGEDSGAVIQAFIAKYGVEEFQALRQMVLAQMGGQAAEGPVGGMGDGMSDSVPAQAGNAPIAVSPGEFIVPADVVSMLGNGDTNAGQRQLYDMMSNVRQAKTGTAQQAPPINPQAMMPGYQGGGIVGLGPKMRGVDPGDEYLRSTASDSVRRALPGMSYAQVGKLDARLQGAHDPKRDLILLNENIDFDPGSNTRDSATMTLFHEGVHSLYKDMPVKMRLKMNSAVEGMTLEELEDFTNREFIMADKSRTLGSFDDLDGFRHNRDFIANEYTALLTTLAYHNLRRFGGDKDKVLDSAEMVEKKYPGAVAASKWVLKQVEKNLQGGLAGGGVVQQVPPQPTGGRERAYAAHEAWRRLIGADSSEVEWNHPRRGGLVPAHIPNSFWEEPPYGSAHERPHELMRQATDRYMEATGERNRYEAEDEILRHRWRIGGMLEEASKDRTGESLKRMFKGLGALGVGGEKKAKKVKSAVEAVGKAKDEVAEAKARVVAAIEEFAATDVKGSKKGTRARRAERFAGR